MIVQQVNLYQDSLKPKQLNARLNGYLTIIGIFCLGLLSLSFYFKNEFTKNQTAVAQVQKNLNTQKALVKQLQEHQPKSQNNTVLLAEIGQWQKKVAELTQTIAILDHETDMQRHGFSAYFQGLANQPVSDVWLNLIHFDARQDMINFEGSTLKPDEIPDFLQHLQKQPVFHGRSFAKLIVEKSEKIPNLMNFKLSTHQPAVKKNHVD